MADIVFRRQFRAERGIIAARTLREKGFMRIRLFATGVRAGKPTPEDDAPPGQYIYLIIRPSCGLGGMMPKNQLFYHFIWSTKYRAPLVDDKNREIIYKSIIAKSIELESIALALNGTEDHLHLLLSASPAMAPSNLIGQIKGSSSHLIRHRGWPDFAWQGEYGVKTVSESDLPRVIQYIQNQQEHHSK
jgi:REP element-mobilizing transposase RayT